MISLVCRYLVLIFATYFVNGNVSPPTKKLIDGRHIPAIALGTWLGHGVNVSSNEVELAVTWAIDAGYRHIDTAAKYKIEDQVGRAISKKLREGIKREDLFITTKLWNDRHAKEEVVPALRESLQRLNLDYVDLYLIHWPVALYTNQSLDYSTDYLDAWRGMAEAKELGLAKSIGVSNFNQEMIDRIIENGLETPSVLQVEINLNLQQPELVAYCKEKGIVVMAYTPFGSLFYSKAKEDAPPPRIDDPTLVEMANKYNKTVPQVALRYLVELGVIPIPKSVTRSRIEQNLQIFDFQLTVEEREKLKAYDKHYRTLPQLKWRDHPYYPFQTSSTRAHVRLG